MITELCPNSADEVEHLCLNHRLAVELARSLARLHHQLTGSHGIGVRGTGSRWLEEIDGEVPGDRRRVPHEEIKRLAARDRPQAEPVGGEVVSGG